MSDDAGSTMDKVYDPATGRYFAPVPPDNIRDIIKVDYLTRTGATAEQFDAVWPNIWCLTDYLYDPASGLTAILDTGILSAHPLLRGCVRETVDFTGEGIEDQAGHGTAVTMIWRMAMPGIPRDQLVILKCAGKDGTGREADLITALAWMRDFNARSSVKIARANISLGIYNRRFGIFPCNGACHLCLAAIETAKSIRLFVAAGNTAGKTACPARAAFLPSKPDIIAATRSDESTAGKGTATGNYSTYANPELRRLVFTPEHWPDQTPNGPAPTGSG